MVSFPRWAIVACAALLVVGFAMPVVAQEGTYQGEVVGKVKSVSADQHRLTVRDADNRDWTFTVNGNQGIRLDNLKVGDRVDVVYSMNGYVPKTIQKLPNDKPMR